MACRYSMDSRRRDHSHAGRSRIQVSGTIFESEYEHWLAGWGDGLECWE
jgi:hypothetical protein